MVTVNSHGGSCCGAKHVRGFGTAENANPNLIDAAVSQSINGQAQEVILNGMQVETYPNILERLAGLGFVLDAHWRNGNHGEINLPENHRDSQRGSHCYRFTRADRREMLMSGPIAGRWTGMVIDPALQGLLIPMYNQGAANVAHYVRPLPRPATNIYTVCGGARGGTYRPGDIVRVITTRSVRYLRELTVIAMIGTYEVRCRDEQEQRDVRFSVDSVQLVRRADQNGEVALPEVGTRVQYLGQTTYDGQWLNGEYATITAVQWPYVRVNFDRDVARGVNLPRAIQLHAQYLHRPENPVPLIAPPGEAERNNGLHNQRHTLGNVPAAVVEEAAAIEAVVLFRSYHNVYRDGRVGAGYDTLELARAGRGRRGVGPAGRVDRKEMLSDGTTRMVENATE